MMNGEQIYRHVKRRQRQNTVYWLSAGPLRVSPPELMEFVWVCFGHWRRLRIARREVLNGTAYVMVDIGYGVKSYTQAQIDLWQRQWSQREAVAA